MIVAILAIILTLVLVVGMHEAGHALVARIFEVKINKISIGFGKPLFQWQSSSGCQWIWAMWPLGGSVQLLNSRINSVEPAEYFQCFDKKPVWIRILILLAGSATNLISAWFAFILLFLIGVNYKLPIVQSVLPNTISAQAGVLPGDQITAIAGHITPSWRDVGMELVMLWGKKDIQFTVKKSKDDQVKNLSIDLSQTPFNRSGNFLLNSMGMIPDLSVSDGLMRSQSVADAVQQANSAFVRMNYFFFMVLKQLVTGVIPFSILLGPLGLFTASVATLMQGLGVFMYFIASLSLAVAIVNLFPVPGLDGGSVIYAIIEKVRGKPISVALEVLIHRLFFIVFCMMLVQLLLNDLQRFFFSQG